MIWFVYLLAHLALVILRYPLAIVAVAFFSTDNKRHLTALQWLETVDNDLSGDSGWKETHLIGDDPLSFWNRVRWLWRNGANALSYGALGVDDMPGWRAAELATNAKAIKHVRSDGAWLYRRFIPAGNCFVELFFGWALLGPQSGRCKFVCSIRLRTSTN